METGMYISNFTLIHKSIRHIEFICFRHTSTYICIYIPMYISPDMLGQECLATDCLSILNFLGLSVCFFFLFFTRPAALFSSWVGSLLQFHEFFPVRFSQNFQLSSSVSLCAHSAIGSSYYYLLL